MKTTTAKVRKKPCPYCQKKLNAPTKHKWYINLARHLGRGTCQPYLRHSIELHVRIWDLLNHFLSEYLTRPSLENTSGYIKALQSRAEVSELERIATLTRSDAATPNSVRSDVEPLDVGGASPKS